MNGRMLALRELNVRIGNLRDERVSQVLRSGDRALVQFERFAVELTGVLILRERNLIGAPLTAGIVWTPPGRYGRLVARENGVDASEVLEMRLDHEERTLTCLLRAVARTARLLH